MKDLWQKFLLFYHKYSYANVLWIGIIYPLWFKSIESRVTVATGYHIMHTKIDEMIPFCEYFILPYYLWFFYILLGVLYFLFTNKEDFYKVCLYLFIGMIFSLLICEIYPNGTDLRPPYISDKNIFQVMVAGLYRVDTPTNVFPSIHAYNSICMHVAIMKSKDIRRLRYGKAVVWGSFLLCLFILKAPRAAGRRAAAAQRRANYRQLPVAAPKRGFGRSLARQESERAGDGHGAPHFPCAGFRRFVFDGKHQRLSRRN